MTVRANSILQVFLSLAKGQQVCKLALLLIEQRLWVGRVSSWVFTLHAVLSHNCKPSLLWGKLIFSKNCSFLVWFDVGWRLFALCISLEHGDFCRIMLNFWLFRLLCDECEFKIGRLFIDQIEIIKILDSHILMISHWVNRIVASFVHVVKGSLNWKQILLPLITLLILVEFAHHCEVLNVNRLRNDRIRLFQLDQGRLHHLTLADHVRLTL